MRASAIALLLLVATNAPGQTAAPTPAPAAARGGAPALRTVRLADERMRDACILPDPATQTYYLVTSSGRRGPNGRPAVVAFTSKDLDTWHGPHVVFEIPENFWTRRGIWAPELHAYQGKFYLFLTFDSNEQLPEQWRDWLPRVKRGSQVLVADSPLGPFQPFDTTRSTLPPDMMTLDGTLYVEDGVPYMVFCHEWVQIKDGTVEFVQLKDDLSATVGEPKRLFHGSDARWSKREEPWGCHVTDGCWFYRTKNGKLLMLWSSIGAKGYTTGFATSKSGKLAGPWEQSAEPLYADDGGHPMVFRTFDGRLMLALHSPNNSPLTRQRLFELEDTGDALRLKSP
jgi:arabinan endo-1,5-alpha-L-arabinosidase